jgi:hypothetical protein
LVNNVPSIFLRMILYHLTPFKVTAQHRQ